MSIFKSGTHTVAKGLSVLAALVLWFYVTTGATFSTTVSVPIRYVMPARGHMPASELPSAAGVRVRGTGRALIANAIRTVSREERPAILINLSGLPDGRHRIAIRPGQIPLGTTRIDIEGIVENGEFEVVIDTRARRSVPVSTDSIPGLVIARDAALAGRPSAIPSRVFVEGPWEVIRTISSVPVGALVENRVSLGDTVLAARLDTGIHPFVTVEPAETKLHFAVEPLLERTFDGIPLRLRGFPRGKRFAAEPDSVTVTVSGPESRIARIGADDISAAIPYTEFLRRLENGNDTVKPVPGFPEGVTAVSVSPVLVRVVPRDR